MKDIADRIRDRIAAMGPPDDCSPEAKEQVRLFRFDALEAIDAEIRKGKTVHVGVAAECVVASIAKRTGRSQ